MVQLRYSAGLAVLLAIGCLGPQQRYSGPERPRAETALLTATSDALVVAIDGASASGGSWAVLPGHHRVWLRVRIFTQSPNMNWTVWSYCQVDFDALASESYETRVRTRKEVASGLSDRVQMEVGISDAGGTLRGVPNYCQAERPDLSK